MAVKEIIVSPFFESNKQGSYKEALDYLNKNCPDKNRVMALRAGECRIQFIHQKVDNNSIDKKHKWSGISDPLYLHSVSEECNFFKIFEQLVYEEGIDISDILIADLSNDGIFLFY